jgi:hypothetical protein
LIVNALFRGGKRFQLHDEGGLSGLRAHVGQTLTMSRRVALTGIFMIKAILELESQHVDATAKCMCYRSLLEVELLSLNELLKLSKKIEDTYSAHDFTELC